MRASRFLTALLALGSGLYVFILWRGHKSMNQSLHVMDVPASVHRPRRRAARPSSTELLGNTSATARNLSSIRRKSQFTAAIGGVAQEKQQRMRLKFQPEPGDNRPPYDTIVDSFGNITGDPSALIHFAVIGFGKCGTTSMISWLDEHPDLQTYPKEVYDLMLDKPADLIQKIYTMPKGNFKRGYKSPNDASLPHVMDYLRRYFPKTKLILGVRHPVLWFESLYNFRVQNLRPELDHEEFPKPNELIGRCFQSARNTCTYKGEFGVFLRNLGKTLVTHNKRSPSTGMYETTELEKRMYAAARMRVAPDIQEPLPNPVFLFEINQLGDNRTAGRFRRDVADFLELDTALPPMVHRKPGRTWYSDELQEVKDKLKINICDDKYIPVRKELMRIARSSSIWIRKYLLDENTLRTGNIRVSSKVHFYNLVEDWMKDPCGDEATKKAGRFILQAAEEEPEVRPIKEKQ